jgi:hypothetical protein
MALPVKHPNSAEDCSLMKRQFNTDLVVLENI